MDLANNIGRLSGNHRNHNIGADLLLLVMGINFDGVTLDYTAALKSLHGLLHCSPT